MLDIGIRSYLSPDHISLNARASVFRLNQVDVACLLVRGRADKRRRLLKGIRYCLEDCGDAKEKYCYKLQTHFIPCARDYMHARIYPEYTFLIHKPSMPVGAIVSTYNDAAVLWSLER